MKKCWDLTHYCVYGIGGYTYSFTILRTRRILGGRMFIIFFHNAAMTVTISNGCPVSTAPEECSPDQKGGPEGVQTDWWVHTRTYRPCVGKLSTHPNCPLECLL